jgi:hypothetical protein
VSKTEDQATLVSLRNVFDRMKVVDELMDFFGASAEFLNEYRRRLKELASAICEEQNVSEVVAMSLPGETALGAKAQEIFSSLNIWLKTQHSSL